MNRERERKSNFVIYLGFINASLEKKWLNVFSAFFYFFLPHINICPHIQWVRWMNELLSIGKEQKLHCSNRFCDRITYITIIISFLTKLSFIHLHMTRLAYERKKKTNHFNVMIEKIPFQEQKSILL